MKSAVSELGLQTLSAERSPKMEIFPTWHLSVSMISVVLSFSNRNQLGVGVQAFLDLYSYIAMLLIRGHMKNAERENRLNRGYLVVLNGRKIG